MRIAYRVIFVLLLAAIVWQAYGLLESKRRAAAIQASAPPVATAPSSTGQQTVALAVAESAGRFSCDGRTLCSQMRSCDEAKYFLKNCPNTKMDGNGDGIPCQIQWCR